MILKICKDFDKIIKFNSPIKDFKGYWYDGYDEVIDFLDYNREHFTRYGVDFSDSMFVPLLQELRAFELYNGEFNEKINNDG